MACTTRCVLHSKLSRNVSPHNSHWKAKAAVRSNTEMERFPNWPSESRPSAGSVASRGVESGDCVESPGDSRSAQSGSKSRV
jgi:hypothetical protein